MCAPLGNTAVLQGKKCRDKGREHLKCEQYTIRGKARFQTVKKKYGIKCKVSAI